jgi:hypothetical protein
LKIKDGAEKRQESNARILLTSNGHAKGYEL